MQTTLTKQGKNSLLVITALLLVQATPAQALVIDAIDSSAVTSSAYVDTAINTAISTMEGLYGNKVTLDVNFAYTNTGSSSYLLQTSQAYDGYSYSAYKAALQADSNHNSANTTLAMAIANLGDGIGSSSPNVAISTGLAAMLGLATPNSGYIPTITINSYYFNSPSSVYNLAAGLEHELDEVLGGGGAGSTLNNPAYFGSFVGATDLLRYSAPGVGSWSATAASSYLSINGGVTNLVNFNQNGGNGDLGDFGATQCAENLAGYQYIQDSNTCSSTQLPGHPPEAYTTSSVEYTMMQALGWNAPASVPEPTAMALLAAGFLGFGVSRRKAGQA